MPTPRTVLPPALLAAPFTSAQARAHGLSPRALDGPTTQRVFRGVHVAATTPLSLRTRIAAARRVLPADASVTGVTALRLLGLVLGAEDPLRFVTASGRRSVRPGLALQRSHQLPAGTDGTVCPAPAWRSAATDLGLVDLVAAGDWLVRRRLVSAEQLRAEATEARGRGVVAGRRAAALVRDRVDSVRETRLRLLLVLAGLPEPACNVRVGSDRRFVATVDLLLARYRTIWEYEGDQHRSDRGQWDHDIMRYEDLVEEGFGVIRVTAQRMRRPRDLVLHSYGVLRAHGYTGPPPNFSPAWIALFE